MHKGMILGMFAAASLSGCISSAPEDKMSFVAPPMQWDHHPEGAEWTESTLVAVSTKDPQLSERVPADIETWCPGYTEASVEERRAFWTGLLSAVARYESTWNENASECLNAGPPLSPRHGMPSTVNSTVSTSPCLPSG